MANTSALETLIDLAQRESDACAKRLGAALKAVEEGEQKLQMLDGYRNDYVARLDAAQMAGITPFAYQNFVAFLGKQYGVRPEGWREAAGHFGEEGSHCSVADIFDTDSLAAVRAYKQSLKSAAKASS